MPWPENPIGELPEPLPSHYFANGRWLKASRKNVTSIVSPVTEQVLFTVPAGGEAEIDGAVAAARFAFDTGPWPRLAPEDRARQVRALGDAIARELVVFKRAWTAQVGGPVALADMLLPMSPAFFAYNAQLASSFAWSEERPCFGGGSFRAVREAVGVCGLIVPWNSPMVILSMKLAAALTAGCTVVIKPSPETPIEALMVAHLADQLGFPPGVINVVPGGRATGELLVAHADVDMISFTGSTSAGKAIGAACSARVARTALELGGKSAAVVLPDADLGTVLGAVVPWSIPFSGQACLGQTRLVVPQARAEEIGSAFAAALGTLPVGDPWDPSTMIGPVVSAVQRDRIVAMIEGAKAEGAQAILGGRGRHPDFERGHYVEPTVFAGVTPGMAVAREEIFGPVVSILSYTDEDEAIAIANATDYGLHGTVFGSDLARLEQVARRIRTGSVGLNCFNHDPAAPFGGYKQSGSGREGGPEGLSEFLETKALYYPQDTA